MNYEQFIKIFDIVDEILHDRDLFDRRKYQLAPAIDLVSGKIQREENTFTEVLSKIKPTYEFAVSVRTELEFEKEKAVQESTRIKERQEAFRKYVEELKDKLRQNIISVEDYRRLVIEYSKIHEN